MPKLGSPAFHRLGDTIRISGSFPTVTSGALTVTGRGFTASRTGTGAYSVVFTDRCGTLLGFFVTLRQPLATSNPRAVPGTWTAATGTHTFFLVGEDGTPNVIDPANDANSVVYFSAEFACIPELI